MIRLAIFARDMVIALALAWIGISIEPAREEACTGVKGADAVGALCTSRGAGFDVAGFGVEIAAEQGCVSTVR